MSVMWTCLNPPWNGAARLTVNRSLPEFDLSYRHIYALSRSSLFRYRLAVRLSCHNQLFLPETYRNNAEL